MSPHAAQARRCWLRVALLCFLVYEALLKSIKVRRAASSDALALHAVAMWGHHGKDAQEQKWAG